MESGASLGPYRIDRELGSGGMGRVYAATLERETVGLAAGTTVALKVVHPHLLETEGFFRRFLQEAQIGAAIRHENVVRTYLADALAAGGVQHNFLVMEYVEGQTLAALQRELDRVPEELCRHVAREICKGLTAIHAAGVVHRDLKPENVLITPGHVVKIMDLGVARLADEQMRLSQSGAFVGSVEYAAPEQFEGRDVDHRCDLHALGVLLYELSTGQHPYRDDDFRGVMRRVCDETPRRAGELNPQLSPLFEEVVQTLLAKSAADRFGNATELLDVLDGGEASTWWKEHAAALRARTRQPLRRIRVPRETAVYGREDELTLLRSLFERADSGDGQVALVLGEAGIGKSRLVDELVARLVAEGREVGFLYGSYPPGGAATAAGAFSTAYREHLGAAGSASYLSETPVLVPAFDALLRGETPPDGVAQLTKDSLQTCFVHVSRALAAERTTIVLVDDLHFAPDEGRALFTALALSVPGSRLLVVGTARPEVPADWLASLTRLDQTTSMPLHRLGPRDLVALLGDSFHSKELAAELSAQIATKSDGNPFFAFEIIRGLREGQFITQRDDGTWVSTRVIDEIKIPSTVLDLVRARVADLAEEERDLLDVAACCGFEFDPLLVGDVLGLSRIPMLKMLGQIERRHRLVRAIGLRYVFDHHQVQEALYESLSELLRREYHGALGDALERRTGAAERDPDEIDGAAAVDICEHLLSASRAGDALRYLPRARAHLRGAFLFQAALDLVRRALDAPGALEGEDRVRALVQIASGELHSLGRGAERETVAREAVRIADDSGDARLRILAWKTLGSVLHQTKPDDAERCLVTARSLAEAAGHRATVAEADALIGTIRIGQGSLAEARERLLRARDLAAAEGDRRAVLDRELGLANVCRFSGDTDAAFEHCRSARELAAEIGDRELELQASITLAYVLFTQGRLVETRESGEEHLSICREFGLRHGQMSAHVVLGNVACLLGEAETARAHYRRAGELARETEHYPTEVVALTNLGLVASMEHELEDAITSFERGLERSRALGYRTSEAVALVNLAGALRSLGDRRRALETAERALSLSRDAGVRYQEGYALHVLGEIANDADDTDAARAWFECALNLRREIDHRDGIADTLLEVADLSRRTGDTEAARAALDEALQISRAQSRDPQIVRALSMAACLPGGDAAEAEDALAGCVDIASSGTVRLLLWNATGDRRHLDAARAHLDLALERVSGEHHDAMCTNVRVNREILEAWHAAGGAAPGASDTTPPDESPTRAG